MMKRSKFISITIAISVLLGFASCGNSITPINDENASEDNGNNPIVASETLPQDGSDVAFSKSKNERPKMALEYVAEFNVGKTPKSWAEGQRNDQSGYYTWEEAKTACPDGYHLPSAQEWTGVFPVYAGKFYVSLDDVKGAERSYDDISEQITVHGISSAYKGDYRNTLKGISYALRFKDSRNLMLAAYRYEKVGDFTPEDLDSYIKVTARYLGPDFDGTVDDIASEAFWQKDSEDDVTRVFPMSGYKPQSKLMKERPLLIQGQAGIFWSSSELNSVQSWYMECDYMAGCVYNGTGITSYSVRPFSQD